GQLLLQLSVGRGQVPHDLRRRRRGGRRVGRYRQFPQLCVRLLVILRDERVREIGLTVRRVELGEKRAVERRQRVGQRGVGPAAGPELRRRRHEFRPRGGERSALAPFGQFAQQPVIRGRPVVPR